MKTNPMDDLDKDLMTLASYNAGPGRIRQLRRDGLNPNVWFGTWSVSSPSGSVRKPSST